VPNNEERRSGLHLAGFLGRAPSFDTSLAFRRTPGKLAPEVHRRENGGRERKHVEWFAVAGVDQVLRTKEMPGRRDAASSFRASPLIRRVGRSRGDHSFERWRAPPVP